MAPTTGGSGLSGRWVLVTEGRSGQSRCSVAVVRALAAAGYRPAVTVSNGLSLAASSRACARRVPVPLAGDPAYPAAIEAELASRDYLTVFPTSDEALLALEVPVRHLLDKSAWPEAAARTGIEVPPTRVFATPAEALAAAGKLTYPVVVKPAIKRYAASLVRTPQALPGALQGDSPVLVQRYLDDELRAVVGLMWKGRLVAAAHQRYLRMWPDPCGTVASAQTIAPDRDLEDRLAALLGDYEGIFHAEFAGPYLLDVNPRAHALLPLASAAGVDLVGLYCDLLLGNDVTEVRGRPGLTYRWLEGDVRSVLKAVRRRRMRFVDAVRALAPRRGVIHSYESLRDPRPMWESLRFSRRRFRDMRARRASSRPRPIEDRLT